jgi:segregation and condensation protein A
MDTIEYKVKTQVFEGPLDVLLSLIEKRKLFINDISLAKVADDYINYVKTLSEFPVDTTAHFILIASTLLLIKSKSLLPTLPLSLEEEASIDDLEHRLKLYKRFKELSQYVSKKFGKEIIFPRLPNKNIPVVFSPDEEITIQNVTNTVQSLIQSFPKKEVIQKGVIKKMISLEEMIFRLTEKVQSNIKMSFGDFAKTQGKTSHTGAKHTVTKEEKVHIIVSFLAMLELVKQGIINANQNNISEDIEIETETIQVPNYN